MTVDQAFGMFEIPNVTNHMMTIIQYGLRLAEESSSIPLVTQGQSGPTTPKTLGGMQLQDNNANQLLRSIGYSFDDFITEPVVRQFYEWLLLDPDVPAEEKGDFKDQRARLGRPGRARNPGSDTDADPAGVAQPRYGLDPKRTMQEFLKSKRFDPRAMKYTDEEQERLDKTPPPVAPQFSGPDQAATDEKIAGADASMEEKAAGRRIHHRAPRPQGAARSV